MTRRLLLPLVAGLALPMAGLHAQDDASPFDANNERRNALERMDTRRVDYTLPIEALRVAADDLEVPMPSEAPAAATFDMIVENADGADHETQVLTMLCRSYRVSNPASEILLRILTGLDRDGSLDATVGTSSVTFAIDNARSQMRCIMDGDLDARCITRVTLGGNAIYRSASGAQRERPIYVRKEQTVDSDGFCAGMTQGAGYVTREATIDLAAAVSEFASEAEQEISQAADAGPSSPTPASDGSEIEDLSETGG